MKSIPEIADALLTYLTETSHQTTPAEFAELTGESKEDVLKASDLVSDYDDTFLLVTETEEPGELQFFSHSETIPAVREFLKSGGFKKLKGI